MLIVVMLRVTFYFSVVLDVMQNVVTLSVVMQNAVILSVVMLNVVTLKAVMLNAIKLSVVAPFVATFSNFFTCSNAECR